MATSQSPLTAQPPQAQLCILILLMPPFRFAPRNDSNQTVIARGSPASKQSGVGLRTPVARVTMAQHQPLNRAKHEIFGRLHVNRVRLLRPATGGRTRNDGSESPPGLFHQVDGQTGAHLLRLIIEQLGHRYIFDGDSGRIEDSHGFGVLPPRFPAHDNLVQGSVDIVDAE